LTSWGVNENLEPVRIFVQFIPTLRDVEQMDDDRSCQRGVFVDISSVSRHSRPSFLQFVWFCLLIRKHASQELQKNGFALIGKDGTPIAKDKADEMLKKLDDETIFGVGQEVGALGDGTFLHFLGAILRYPFEHPDQVVALLKLLLPLLLAL
jgi:hypothetical protein